MAKRKEIKFRREGRTLTGRQDGVIFTIFEDRERIDTCAPAYYVRANDTKDLGRSIDTGKRQYFHLDGAKEFCQQIMAGEVDLEAMQAEIDAERAAKEQAAIRAATERAKRFRDKPEAAGTSFNTLLDLQAAYDADMDSLAHNILLGFESGEGFPNV